MSINLLAAQITTYPVLPKSMVTLQNLHEKHLKITTKTIKKSTTDGEMVPRLVAIWDAKREAASFNLPWQDAEEKVGMLNAVRALFNMDCPDRYTFASEVWVASGDLRDANGHQVPPSDRPDHRDAVIIISVDKNEVLADSYAVITTCGKRLIGDKESMTTGDFEGRLTNLMKPIKDFDRSSIFGFERRR
jgi:hypothetical protein